MKRNEETFETVNEKEKNGLVKCDQAKGVLAWLICQCVCAALIIRATQFGAFEQEIWKKEHTHLSILEDEGKKNESFQRRDIQSLSRNSPEKKINLKFKFDVPSFLAYSNILLLGENFTFSSNLQRHFHWTYVITTGKWARIKLILQGISTIAFWWLETWSKQGEFLLSHAHVRMQLRHALKWLRTHVWPAD